MLRGLYTAYTGMKVQQQRMDVVANNLANASTAGFKQDNVVMKSFSDVLAVKINDPNMPGNQNIGSMTLGVQVDNIYTNFEQGALNYVGSPYSLAIEGEGMMTIGSLNDDGTFNEVFTRDGALLVDNNSHLVTKNGFYVLGEQGVITVPEGDFAIAGDGTVFVDGEKIDKIQFTGFEDYRNLQKIGDSNYAMTEFSTKTDFMASVRHGYEESSNVNSVKEMIEMINLQRTYESNQKVITTYDETLDKAVNNVGRV